MRIESSASRRTYEVPRIVCFFPNIGGKFTGIIYYRTLFREKTVKQLCLLFKISYVFIVMKEKRYGRNFFVV